MVSREFNELIEPTIIHGKLFVPAQRIAQLAFNMKAAASIRKSKMWINNGYDNAMHYGFELQLKPDLRCNYWITISRNFDISGNVICNGIPPPTNTGMPVCNQIKIFELLKEWGFIETKKPGT